MFAVENLRPPIPSDFRDSCLDSLFARWWNGNPRLRPEFKEIVESIQVLHHGAEEGALDEIRRRSHHRLSISPQPLYSPEFSPVTENAPASFDMQSSSVAPHSSRKLARTLKARCS